MLFQNWLNIVFENTLLSLTDIIQWDHINYIKIIVRIALTSICT